MNANNFIRDCGLNEAKRVLRDARGCESTRLWGRYEFKNDNLKRLIESHELVDLWGGIGRCKFFMMGMKLNKCDSVKCPKTGMIISKTKLEQAIADVESCK